MKALVNLATIYGIMGMLSGLFYREFGKMMGYEGPTVLASVHTHLLSMGMIFMLVILLLVKSFPMRKAKWYKPFLWTYTIAFIWSMVMMTVRGVLEVMSIPMTSMSDGMVAGLAGLGHIGLFVAFIFLFLNLRKSVS